MPYFGEISQSKAEIKLLPFSETDGPILEFYFRFWFWPNFRHQCVILHRPTKFCQNWTTLRGIMTSYPFFDMAAGLQQYWIWSRQY